MKKEVMNVSAPIVVGRQDGYVLPLYQSILSVIASADGAIPALVAKKRAAMKDGKAAEAEACDIELAKYRSIANGGRRAFLVLEYDGKKPFDVGALALAQGDESGVAVACGMVGLLLGLKVSAEACAELARCVVLSHKRLRANASAVAAAGFTETSNARTDFVAAFFGGLWDTLKAHGTTVSEDGAITWPKWFAKVSLKNRLKAIEAAAGVDLQVLAQAAKVEAAMKDAKGRAERKAAEAKKAAEAARLNGVIAMKDAKAEKAAHAKVEDIKAKAAKAEKAEEAAKAAKKAASTAAGVATRAAKAAQAAETEAQEAADRFMAAQFEGKDASEVQAIEAEAREKVRKAEGLAKKAEEAKKAAEAKKAEAEKAAEAAQAAKEAEAKAKAA